MQDIAAALEHLRQAQADGNFTEQGKALQGLDTAAKAYEAAKSRNGGNTTTTTTPPPGNGGG